MTNPRETNDYRYVLLLVCGDEQRLCSLPSLERLSPSLASFNLYHTQSLRESSHILDPMLSPGGLCLMFHEP